MQKLTSLLAASLALGALTSYGQTVISQVPYQITRPGSYVLENSLSFSEAGGHTNAIEIKADNVTLDFAGHTLAHESGSQAGSGVLVDGTHLVTIKNGTVSNFHFGILLQSGGSNVVENMRVLGGNSVGIDLSQQEGSIVQNNFVNMSGQGQFGIACDAGSLSNHLLRNNVLGPVLGIFEDDPGGNYLESNFVSNCSTGITTGRNSKFRLNTTINCQTPFNGNGTPVGRENN